MPILERLSGLKFNRDFFCGYSPERINPGDKQHRLTTIKKITSGSTPEVADFVDSLYASIIKAGTHKASSIRVAEAAKVIENTQRDVNIALINELALIFNRLGIDTEEVLRGGRHQVELPAVPSRPGRRPLHRRRSVLPDAQGAGDRLSPGDDPRGPAHQRQHGDLRRRARRAADDPQAHPRQGLAHPGDGPDVQGELPRPAQLQGRRRRARAEEIRREGRRVRPVGRCGRSRARVRHQADPQAGEGHATTRSCWRSRTRSSATWASTRSAASPASRTCCTTSSTCSRPARSTDVSSDRAAAARTHARARPGWMPARGGSGRRARGRLLSHRRAGTLPCRSDPDPTAITSRVCELR